MQLQKISQTSFLCIMKIPSDTYINKVRGTTSAQFFERTNRETEHVPILRPQRTLVGLKMC